MFGASSVSEPLQQPNNLNPRFALPGSTIGGEEEPLIQYTLSDGPVKDLGKAGSPHSRPQGPLRGHNG
jgi:hypothetical protein